jgi:hypothetical protein
VPCRKVRRGPPVCVVLYNYKPTSVRNSMTATCPGSRRLHKRRRFRSLIPKFPFPPINSDVHLRYERKEPNP